MDGHSSKRSFMFANDKEPESDIPLKRPRGSHHSMALQEIPTTSFYQVSYAHRGIITFICYSRKYDMVISASEDGIVKFWKRVASGSVPIPSALGDKSSSSQPNLTGKCLEFVKSYLAHTSPILNVVTSLPDGDICASIGEDNMIKFYDIGSFDVTGMIKLKGTGITCGNCAAFIGEDQLLLAVSASAQSVQESGLIYIFSVSTLSQSPVKVVKLHAAPISVMAYNYSYHVVISSDSKGIIEYWNGSLHPDIGTTSSENNVDSNFPLDEYEALDMTQPNMDNKAMIDRPTLVDRSSDSIGTAPTYNRNGIQFQSKLNETDLYALVKKKAHPVSLAISPQGSHIAIYGSDRKVRIFEFTTGKLRIQYDERMQVYDALMQKNHSFSIDAVDYGKRAAIEREMSETTILSRVGVDTTVQECGHQKIQLQFDPSGSFLFLPTLLGIKIIDLDTHKCSNIIGKGDSSVLRFLGGCLCLGDAKVDRQMLLARTGGSSAAVGSDDTRKKVDDSLVISLAFKKRRFYIFSHVDPFQVTEGDSKESIDHQDIVLSRDVLNEPPDVDDLMLAANQKAEEKNRLGNEAVLRTTMGDIHIRLFPGETPRTVENFCGHARSGYYDNVIFHRVIKVWLLFVSVHLFIA
jgi:peptidylprolyl isomerase domain and WD repeat-containing protein 1